MISLLDHSDDSEFSKDNSEVTDSSSRNQEKKSNYHFKFSLSVGDRGKTIEFQNLFFEIVNMYFTSDYFFQSGAKRLFGLYSVQLGSQIIICDSGSEKLVSFGHQNQLLFLPKKGQ